MIQRSAGELEVNYVMSRNLTPEEQARLAAALTTRLGYAFTFDWQRRQYLERTKGGKFEDFMSQLPVNLDATVN